MNTFGTKCRPHKIKTVVVSISIFNNKWGGEKSQTDDESKCRKQKKKNMSERVEKKPRKTVNIVNLNTII